MTDLPESLQEFIFREDRDAAEERLLACVRTLQSEGVKTRGIGRALILVMFHIIPEIKEDPYFIDYVRDVFIQASRDVADAVDAAARNRAAGGSGTITQ